MKRMILTMVLAITASVFSVQAQGVITDPAAQKAQQEAIKAQQKSSEITEDDAKQMQNQLQKDTDKFIADLDKLTSKKEAELNEI